MTLARAILGSVFAMTLLSSTALAQSSPPESPAPAASPAGGAALFVSGTGDALCPWGEELPIGSDALTGRDNTTNARDFIFEAAPEDLDAANRLQSSWSAYPAGAIGAIAPGCSVYLFDAVDIEAIWDWYVMTYADRSAPAPTEEPVPDEGPGEDARLFHFPSSFDRESWTYVFRAGNVIAAVSLDSAVGSDATVDDVIVLADAVASRVEAAAAGDPRPAAPTPTPEPDFPSAAEADLLEHVPPSHRDRCARTTFARSELALAAVSCGVPIGPGSITVTYQRLEGVDALNEVYESTLSFLSVGRDTGPCGSGWPAEGAYTIGGEPVGRVGCAMLGSTAAIISWTDERLLIHGYAEGFGLGREAVYEWWIQDSGPLAPADTESVEG